MEKQNIKRGIDFRNRLWESGLGDRVQHAFVWWKGGKLSKTSFFLIFTVFIINLFIIYPIFTRNTTPSFSSSAFFPIADFFENLRVLNKSQFFSFLTFFSLSLAPVSYYFFVRKMVLRHEPIAFLATIFYIFPNVFFNQGSPLARAVLNGDGANALVFSFMPLFLLYVQAFIATGVPIWGAMSSIGVAAIAIFSPFAMFNFLILVSIITVAEGFLGNLRIKAARLLFLLLTSIALSFFWYSPAVIAKIVTLSHVSFAIQKIWSIFPILVPAIPVLGAISFLVFDRREKLRPIFIGIASFLSYFFLFTASKALNAKGIFIASRYMLELSFASSFLFAVFFVLVSEIVIRNSILKSKGLKTMLIGAILSLVVVIFLLVSGYNSIRAEQKKIAREPIVNSYSSGIGAIKRSFDPADISSIFADLISLATFIFLISVISRYSSLTEIKKISFLSGKNN